MWDDKSINILDKVERYAIWGYNEPKEYISNIFKYIGKMHEETGEDILERVKNYAYFSHDDPKDINGNPIYKYICKIYECYTDSMKDNIVEFKFNSCAQLKEYLDKKYGDKNWCFDELVILTDIKYRIFAEGHGEVTLKNKEIININFETEENRSI